MGWKPEHHEARMQREAANPELREKRLQQAKDSQERNKEARKQYMKDYYKANPGKYKLTQEDRDRRNAARREKYAQDKEWRESHKQSVKQWQEQNPEKRKSQRLKKTHGIELSDYKDMLAVQNNQCAICGYSDTKNPKLFPVVDHCHTRGRIRGLLCMNCNQGLGKFKDDPNLLMAAAAYLSRHG